MRTTTVVAASSAPRSTPQASATPGAAYASALPWTSRGASAPSPPRAHASARNASAREQRAAMAPRSSVAAPASTVTASSARRSDTVAPSGDDLAGPGVVANGLQRRARAVQHVLDLLAEERTRRDGRGQRAGSAAIADELDGLGPQHQPRRRRRRASPARAARAAIDRPERRDRDRVGGDCPTTRPGNEIDAADERARRNATPDGDRGPRPCLPARRCPGSSPRCGRTPPSPPPGRASRRPW